MTTHDNSAAYRAGHLQGRLDRAAGWRLDPDTVDQGYTEWTHDGGVGDPLTFERGYYAAFRDAASRIEP